MAADKSKNGFTFNRQWGGIYGTDLASPLGRIAFVSLDKPTGLNGQTPKYGLSLLVPKDDADQKPFLVGIQTQCKLMISDLWGDKADEMLKKTKRPFLRSGDEPSSTGKVYEGYAGTWVIVARNGKPMGHNQGWRILNPDKTPDSFEGGMICRLTIQPYLGPDGFSYTLRAIKLVKDDGVRFGGAPDPTGVIDHLDEAVAAVSTNVADFGMI